MTPEVTLAAFLAIEPVAPPDSPIVMIERAELERLRRRLIYWRRRARWIEGRFGALLTFTAMRLSREPHWILARVENLLGRARAAEALEGATDND